jgi:ABC-type phosphate transport system substrate-binding protein
MTRRGALIGLLLAAAATRPAIAGELAIIVHPGRDAHPTRAELAEVYLKTRRFWDDGEPIIPVNRNSGSPARALFDRAVLGEDEHELLVYWNRQYFRGVLPPATFASDEAVKRFVASEPRAIGYIDASLVDPSVKVVLRIPGH